MPAERIYLVSNDNLPTITLTLDKEIPSATSASAHLRKVGQTTVVTIPCVLDIPNKKISFEFPDGALPTAGDYEAEIEISFAGKKQTLYRPLSFRVRQQFA